MVMHELHDMRPSPMGSSTVFTPQTAASAFQQKKGLLAPTHGCCAVRSASRNPLFISITDPKSSPEYSDVLYLCGNQWRHEYESRGR